MMNSTTVVLINVFTENFSYFNISNAIKANAIAGNNLSTNIIILSRLNLINYYTIVNEHSPEPLISKIFLDIYCELFEASSEFLICGVPAHIEIFKSLDGLNFRIFMMFVSEEIKFGNIDNIALLINFIPVKSAILYISNSRRIGSINLILRN